MLLTKISFIAHINVGFSLFIVAYNIYQFTKMFAKSILSSGYLYQI